MSHRNSIWLSGFGAYDLASKNDWVVEDDGSIRTPKGILHIGQKNELMLNDKILMQSTGNISKNEKARIVDLVLAAYEEAQ